MAERGVRISLLALLVVPLLAAGVATCASAGVAPAAIRVASPIACPSDTKVSAVVARWGGSAKGGRSLRWDLYCVNAEGEGYMPGDFASVGGAFLVFLGGALAGWVVFLGAQWLRRRGRGDAR